MIRFELKKVFSRKANKIALIILIVFMIVTTIFAINDLEYIDQEGNSSSGLFAARQLREAKNQWAGFVTESVLEQVIEENHRIAISKQAKSEDVQEQNKAFAKMQGFYSIRSMMNAQYSGFDGYEDGYVDGLKSEEVKGFYARRVSSLEHWLKTGDERFSSVEKEFLIQRYESLETPLYYEYFDGWPILLQNISTFLIVLGLAIGFFVSGIFSDEFQLNAAPIFFSSRLGRNRATRAKVVTGFLLITVIYFVFVSIYTGIVLFVLGGDGGGCAIQWDMWKSQYNVTFFQAYLLIVLGGYVGVLFSSALAMLVSAKTHSTVLAVVAPFLVLCMLPFCSRIIPLPQICALFPDRLMDIYTTIKEIGMLEIRGHVLGFEQVLIPVYFAGAILILAGAYLAYKRAAVQ